MTDAVASSLLAELEAAVGASRSQEAVDAAVKALHAKTPSAEVMRAAARGAASHYDAASGAPPRGLAVLASAMNLCAVMQPRFHPLPTLQALSFVASEKKASSPARAPLVVSGEVTHLGRSFLFAVRAGDLPEAESIFLGMVDEGWERKMAGDMLFRAAVEDMGEAGRKFFIAVKAWQLARSLGFKDARTILRPAVQYLVKGPRDRAPYETILSVLGKEWTDLEALASGGRPLDDPGRAMVRAIVTAPDPPSCVSATLEVLREGYAAASVAESLAVEAAKRVVAAKGYDLETARALMFAHAARFVLIFSRTSERLYALFQAALRIRSPEPGMTVPDLPEAPGEGEALCHLAGEFDARKPSEAVARARSYVARRYPASRMLDVLANYACRDSALANDGINVIFADAAATEFMTTKAPEFAMALAKVIAASPKDQAAYEAWKPLLGP